MERRSVTTANRGRGSLLTRAGAAPILAGVLALVAAGLLVTFSMWAQKVVLEGADISPVQPHAAAGKSGAPVVLGNRTEKARAGGRATNDQAVALQIIDSNSAQTFEPQGPGGGGTPPGTGTHQGPGHEGSGPGPYVLAGGRLGQSYPAERPVPVVTPPVERPPVDGGERGAVCPPRRVRGAPKDQRIEPPGLCKREASGEIPAAAHGPKEDRPQPTDAGVPASLVLDHHGNGHAYGHGKSKAHEEYTQGHRWGGPDPSDAPAKARESAGTTALGRVTHGNGHAYGHLKNKVKD